MIRFVSKILPAKLVMELECAASDRGMSVVDFLWFIINKHDENTL